MPGRLDEDVVESALLEQPLDALHEVFAHGAAHAAVAHFDDLVLLVFDEVAVDADLADLVDDDGKLVLGSARAGCG